MPHSWIGRCHDNVSQMPRDCLHGLPAGPDFVHRWVPHDSITAHASIWNDKNIGCLLAPLIPASHKKGPTWRAQIWELGVSGNVRSVASKMGEPKPSSRANFGVMRCRPLQGTLWVQPPSSRVQMFTSKISQTGGFHAGESLVPKDRSQNQGYIKVYIQCSWRSISMRISHCPCVVKSFFPQRQQNVRARGSRV